VPQDVKLTRLGSRMSKLERMTVDFILAGIARHQFAWAWVPVASATLFHVFRPLVILFSADQWPFHSLELWELGLRLQVYGLILVGLVPSFRARKLWHVLLFAAIPAIQYAYYQADVSRRTVDTIIPEIVVWLPFIVAPSVIFAVRLILFFFVRLDGNSTNLLKFSLLFGGLTLLGLPFAFCGLVCWASAVMTVSQTERTELVGPISYCALVWNASGAFLRIIGIPGLCDLWRYLLP
jgi:hypothetical protein